MAAVAERAQPSENLSGAAPDPFLAQVTQAQADLAEAVERAGLGRDPYRFLIGALAHTLDIFPVFIGRVTAAAEHVRQPIDAAVLERFEAAAAKGASRRTADLAYAHMRRTTFLYASSLVAGMVLAAGLGFAGGRMTVQPTDRRLAAAFRDGPDAAESWATLMENNDLPHALSSCTGARSYTDQTGRKVCLMALFVDPPRRRPPEGQRR